MSIAGSLPDGMEQYVGKGHDQSSVEFSGWGQEIAIVRALLKDSICVVLDKPAIELDPLAEMKLYRQINRRLERSPACLSHICSLVSDSVI